MPIVAAAKYRCSRVTTSSDDKGELTYEAELMPVADDLEKNPALFSSTPMGTIRLPFLKQEIANLFVPGKEFYVDFTPID